VFERERHESIRDVGIDCKSMHQTAIHPMDTRALLANQRAVDRQMTRDPHRARIHATACQHDADTRLGQTRDRVCYVGIGYRFMARTRRNQRAVDVERDELYVLHTAALPRFGHRHRRALRLVVPSVL
jgi:hypothetical protein